MAQTPGKRKRSSWSMIAAAAYRSVASGAKRVKVGVSVENCPTPSPSSDPRVFKTGTIHTSWLASFTFGEKPAACSTHAPRSGFTSTKSRFAATFSSSAESKVGLVPSSSDSETSTVDIWPKESDSDASTLAPWSPSQRPVSAQPVRATRTSRVLDVNIDSDLSFSQTSFSSLPMGLLSPAKAHAEDVFASSSACCFCS